MEFTWADLRLGGVSVVDCISVGEAELCSYILTQAQIPNVIIESQGKLDTRWPQIKVAPDDAERAAEILSKPVDENVRRDFEELGDIGDFPPPSCPHCDSTEILLDSADPINLWSCEACGEHWKDPEPDDVDC